MKLLAPAKINLTLEVLGRRADGYHALRSVMVPLALYDEITIDPAQSFGFACDAVELSGEENLAARAARAIDQDAAVHITLRKLIPVQAGLGGGSSDAAAILHGALGGAFGREYHHDWLHLARSLGSDVPFFLTGSGALVEATGERVTAIGAIPPWHVLIVKPPVPVSTSDAYAALDRVERPSRPRSTSSSLAMVSALQRTDFAQAESLLNNDFHEVALTMHPEIAHAARALRDAGAKNVLLCGSGSALFTMCADAATAQAIDQRLSLASSYHRYRAAFAPTTMWRAAE